MMCKRVLFGLSVPLMGPTASLHKVKIFAVMLAYFEGGAGKFGIIYDVSEGDCYHGGGLS